MFNLNDKVIVIGRINIASFQGNLAGRIGIVHAINEDGRILVYFDNIKAYHAIKPEFLKKVD